MILSISELVEKFNNSQIFSGKVLENEELKNHTTMKTGSYPALFIQPEDELSVCIAWNECKRNGLRIFILGGGSNVVVSEKPMNNLAVISTDNLKSKVYSKEEKTVSFGSGTKISEINSFLQKESLGGFEKFGGLPGTVGGACFMNARCYEADVSNFVKEIQYIDFDEIPSELTADAEKSYAEKVLSSALKVYEKADSDWAYKVSPFQKKNALITKVTLQGFTEKDSALIKEQSDFYFKDRIEKGHFKFPSAGSVFKNNHSFGKPTGRLIDEAGLKGTVRGGAQIAPWHGNFIINCNNGTCSDIKELVKLAQDKVKENTGFFIEPEIIFLE